MIELNDIDLRQPLEPQIRQRFVRLTLNALEKDLSYRFDATRADRIAEGMGKIIEEDGLHPVNAFSVALETEILLYGNPAASGDEPKGILRAC